MFLGFSHIHENKLFFCYFLKREINLKFLKFFEFFKNISEKTRYFNTGFVSYSVNI